MSRTIDTLSDDSTVAVPAGDPGGHASRQGAWPQQLRDRTFVQDIETEGQRAFPVDHKCDLLQAQAARQP